MSIKIIFLATASKCSRDPEGRLQKLTSEFRSAIPHPRLVTIRKTQRIHSVCIEYNKTYGALASATSSLLKWPRPRRGRRHLYAPSASMSTYLHVYAMPHFEGTIYPGRQAVPVAFKATYKAAFLCNDAAIGRGSKSSHKLCSLVY